MNFKPYNYAYYVEIKSPRDLEKVRTHKKIHYSKGNYSWLFDGKAEKLVKKGMRIYLTKDFKIEGYDQLNVAYAKTTNDVADYRYKLNKTMKLWKKKN